MPESATTQTNPNEGEKQAKDLSNYIPKTDFEKVTKEKDSTIANLSSSLRDSQEKLTSPEYIEFLESRSKTRDVKVTKEDLKGAQMPDKVIELIEGLQTTFNQRFSSVETFNANVAAWIEAQEVSSKYKDFDEYRDQVAALLEKPGVNLTIEQAYKIVKSDKTPASEETPKPSGERPGGRLPQNDTTVRKFKTSDDAGQAAWDEVAKKHGITGDTI